MQESHALTEDDFDFTDAVRNPPSEDRDAMDESDRLLTVEGELSGFTVTLDPGHRSEVNDGLTEQHGVTECHINWVLTNEIADILRSYGCNVIMTKSDEDQLVTNMERAEIANSNDSAAFIRLHCDSGPPEAHGMTFYYPDRQGEWYGHTGPPLELIPLCEQLATILHEVTTRELDGLLNDRGVQTDKDNETYIGNRQGGALRGSILSEVPVCLIEVCFLSNADDVAIITNDEKRSEIANALAEGIRQYLIQLPTE
jgi:N-acetylmuramoyl-L-alanine amidase